MNTILLLFVILIVVGVGIRLIDRFDFGRSSEKLPYRLKPYFFNKSELAFYLELKKVLPDGYHIFSKVRIIDFIEPTDKTNYAKWRNKIWAKHVDFLVCDQGTKPVVAIEVDGKSHQSQRRIERDSFLDKVFADTGLRFQRVSVGSDFAGTIKNIFSGESERSF